MDYEYNLYTNVLLNREVSYESSQQKNDDIGLCHMLDCWHGRSGMC